ncbi:MAG: hypothetical protein ACI8X5_003974 [Planctomycetota bacterium]|jgi:hypothetical protein
MNFINPLFSLASLTLLAGVSSAKPQSTTSPELPQIAETPEPTVEKSNTEFEPMAPASDGFDWIQLTSGEWLKGEILSLRDGTLEFDSDELGVLKLDIDDVAILRSPRNQAIQLDGFPDLVGTLLINDGVVTIGGPDGGTADRKYLMSVVPGGSDWRTLWSGKASLGFTLRSGNSSQTDVSSYFFARRQTTSTRWDTTFNGNYSQAQSVEIANSNRLDSHYDFFLSRRLFVTPLSVAAHQDRFSNIDLRLTPSALIGYDLLDDNMVNWEVSGGPAYNYTRYNSVQDGESSADESLAVLLATSIEWDLTSDVEFDFGYDITIPTPDTDEYIHHLSAILSLEVIEWLDVDLSFIWDRINKPLADADGVTPEPDDYRLVIGFGIDF